MVRHDTAVGRLAQGACPGADFAVLTRALTAKDTAQRTLDRLCKMAVDAISGAEHAGIAVIGSTRYETPAASDAIPPMADRIQYETGRGPGVKPIRPEEVLLLGDLSTEQRWDTFAARMVTETGMYSMVCYGLFVYGDTVGTLNLYSAEPWAFTRTNRDLGAIFAEHAALTMQAAVDRDQVSFQDRTSARRQMHAATGSLRGRHAVIPDGRLRQIN